MVSERLRADEKALDDLATALQCAKIKERANGLTRKFKAWDEVHLLYMPAVAVLRACDDKDVSALDEESPIYDTLLYLPSSLPMNTSCDLTLQRYEFRLREAQAYDALEELRQRLCLQSHMWKWKDKNTVGQRASTRQQGLIGRVDKKVKVSTTKYRMARAALAKLGDHVGEFKWRDRLLPLHDDHIRRLDDPGSGISESKRVISWIWMVIGVGAGSEDAGMQEGERTMNLVSLSLNLNFSICSAAH